MILKTYESIPRINDILMQKFRKLPTATSMHWCVTELIDGDHMALYYSYSTKEFKVSARNKFIFKEDSYSCASEVVSLYKDWVVELGELEKSNVIVYGKATGGHYAGKYKGMNIKTVCEYMADNEFIIHDVFVNDKFCDIMKLQRIAKANLLTVAPLLYNGPLGKAICYPENGLSAVPFGKKLPVNYSNEMKGIVIRPLYDLTCDTGRVMVKKLNNKYIGIQEKRKVVDISDSLIEIAVYIDNEAMRMTLMQAILVAVGKLSYQNVPRVAGKYTAKCLDRVNYLKYSLLKKDDKHLVNKYINKLAEERLLNIIRMESAA